MHEAVREVERYAQGTKEASAAVDDEYLVVQGATDVAGKSLGKGLLTSPQMQ